MSVRILFLNSEVLERKEMGNCLKSPTSDDISLLHESQSDRASFGDGTFPDQEPPPPYQVNGFTRKWQESRFIVKLRGCF